MNALQSVDLLTAEGRPVPGLVPVPSDGIPDGTLPVDEQAAVWDAQLFGQINYVFFRRFNDGRSSQVAAYVVDNSSNRLTEESLSQLHHQLWLHGAAPLLYVAWATRIDVLSCARGADFWDDSKGRYRYRPVAAVEIAAQVSSELKKYSAFRLADGTLWDDEHRLANYDKAAHSALIRAVVDTDGEMQKQRIPELRPLLLLVVLIKYLEDRDVFSGNGWWGRWRKGAKSFVDVLQGGNRTEVERLLAFLEERFNGDVFRLPHQAEKALTEDNLRKFASLVEARTIGNQLYFWKLFSFGHIPIEVISNLYQRFIPKGQGAVYTPPFLAALLLDRAMPYKTITDQTTVLDPACGSGVFLVGAFRRLVNKWRSKHNWARPDVDTLKSILKGNIFGIDLDETAIDLTVFSLSLALCDALRPDVIWNELRFERLRGKNLIHSDFFEVLEPSKGGSHAPIPAKFDIVIGNPPFQSKISTAGGKIDRRAKKLRSNGANLPDRQAAYLFLEQSASLLRPNGLMCLLQPSEFLHNRKVDDFRNAFFQGNCVTAILDFTSIRGIFEGADKKAIAILSTAPTPPETGEHWISHLTFRRTASVQQRVCFELDHYDHHRVSQQLALEDRFVWRTNLLGGGRLLSLSRRLREMRTLKEYIDSKKGEGWDYGEGFIVGSGGKKAPRLTGQPLLPTTALTDNGIEKVRITKVREKEFDSPRNESRFQSPLLLIKEAERLPIGFWDTGNLAYRDKIVGIHAPEAQSKELRTLYGNLLRHRTFLRFSCALNGTQALVGKSTAILKQDIDLLPYPNNLHEFDLSKWEEALQFDVLNYMLDLVRLGQNSKLLKTAATCTDLDAYSALFIQMLGSVYTNLSAARPIFWDTLICQPFFFGEAPEIALPTEGDEGALREIIFAEDRHASLRTVRLLRIYDKNTLLLVKPNRLRYWIHSTAIRDADETLPDLVNWGY